MAAGWSDALRKPLAGDASGRRYERLLRGDETAVLMIAPERDADGLRRFERLSDHLRNLGLSAPQVLKVSPDEGLMLLEDLGDRLYPASIAANPAHEPELYSRALDCLFILQSAPPPEGPTVFSSEEMARQASLPFFTWAEADADTPCPFEDGLKAALDEVAPQTPALMLRDFHAENLFWLPERPGPSAVGLIDFQDARLSSPLYDIVSLLWDARRDVPHDLREGLLLRTAERLGRSLSDVRAEAATLSLQRNLRILGVFARLAAEGRTGYLAHVPRVWRHIEEALSARHLAALSRSIREVLPAPADARFSSAHLSCTPTPARS